MGASEFNIQRIGLTCSHMCVEMELKGLHIKYKWLTSGKLEILSETSDVQMKELHRRLKEKHLELVEAKPDITSENIKKLIRALFTDKNLTDEKCRSQYLYDALRCSKLTIARTFKKEEGISIRQYYTSVRMKRAKKMLKNPKYSLEDIITSCAIKIRDCFSNNSNKLRAQLPKSFGMSI